MAMVYSGKIVNYGFLSNAAKTKRFKYITCITFNTKEI